MDRRRFIICAPYRTTMVQWIVAIIQHSVRTSSRIGMAGIFSESQLFHLSMEPEQKNQSTCFVSVFAAGTSSMTTMWAGCTAMKSTQVHLIFCFMLINNWVIDGITWIGTLGILTDTFKTFYLHWSTAYFFKKIMIFFLMRSQVYTYIVWTIVH